MFYEKGLLNNILQRYTHERSSDCEQILFVYRTLFTLCLLTSANHQMITVPTLQCYIMYDRAMLWYAQQKPFLCNTVKNSCL